MREVTGCLQEGAGEREVKGLGRDNERPAKRRFGPPKSCLFKRLITVGKIRMKALKLSAKGLF